MRKKSELSELTDNTFRVFMIIVFSVLISLATLITAKIYQDRQDTSETQVQTISLDSENFPTLQLGHYCLWVVDHQGQYRFLKRFNSIKGRLVSLDGTELQELPVDTLRQAKEFVVTIEQEGDRDKNPNDFELMRGALTENSSQLRFDLQNIGDQQRFLLATPSDGNNTINERSGLWFVDEDLQTQGLTLDELTDGRFSYQARLQNTSTGDELNIGYFRDPKTKDDFQSFSLSSSVFNFPGEDLLRNLPGDLEPPINLANGDYKIIVSLEPMINNSDFTGEEVFVEIMSTEIPQNLEPYRTQLLDITFKPILLSLEINE